MTRLESRACLSAAFLLASVLLLSLLHTTVAVTDDPSRDVSCRAQDLAGGVLADNAESSCASAPAAEAAAAAKPSYPAYAHAVAGAGGGLATVLLLHPLDTLKTRLQSDAASRRGGALLALRSIVRRDGPAGLYRGAVPAVVGAMSSWAFYMHWFHAVRGMISKHVVGGPPSALTDFLSGTSAGILTAVATNPIWVVKVRLQLQRRITATAAGSVAAAAAAGSAGAAAKAGAAQSGVVYSGFLHGLRCIARDEGVRGLYKGLGPSLWLVSHGAIQFTLYERFKIALAGHDEADVGRNATEGTSVRDSLLASTASKLVAASATYPLQLVRTRMQEVGAGGDRYGDLLSGFARVLRTEGIRGFYRGLGTNVVRVLPQSAVTFITYEQLMKACIFLHRRAAGDTSAP